VRQGAWRFRDTQREARQRRNKAILRVLLIVASVAAIAWFSFDAGRRNTEYRILMLEDRFAELDSAMRVAAQSESEARAALGSAVSEAAAWRERYETEVPQGESAILWQLLTRRLNEGVEPQRLAEVVELVANERRCDPQLVSKRIIVKTHLHGGTDTSAGFADSRLTVMGEGEADRDADNNPVAWYNPAEPVAVSFVTIGGETEVVEGYLPINHAVVLGTDEYRFVVTEGPRNFAMVTAERCDFP
tara:strand:- start:3163 stop:3900 length:738 start_codon:yes stop_codon:yes gene_type:complete